MSKIKDLRTNPENNINIIDMLSLMIPFDKSIYFEVYLKLMKKTKNLDIANEEIKANLHDKYGIDFESLNNIPTFHLIFYLHFFEFAFNREDIIGFQRFCELNEKKLIRNNDILSYTSFDEILKSVNIAELKIEEKNLENQTIKLFENEEYLIIRPLTYLSSKKYGANTKWCTTSVNNYSYFKRYSSDGILLYVLNKINGEKVGIYFSLKEHEAEFSFWDQIDARVDSLQTNLPHYILDIIKKETILNKRSNRSYLTKLEIRTEDNLNEIRDSKRTTLEPQIGELGNAEPSDGEQPYGRN